MKAFDRRKDFKIWKSRVTGQWIVYAPGHRVMWAPTFRAAVAVMDAWRRDR